MFDDTAAFLFKTIRGASSQAAGGNNELIEHVRAKLEEWLAGTWRMMMMMIFIDNSSTTMIISVNIHYHILLSLLMMMMMMMSYTIWHIYIYVYGSYLLTRIWISAGDVFKDVGLFETWLVRQIARRQVQDPGQGFACEFEMPDCL